MSRTLSADLRRMVAKGASQADLLEMALGRCKNLHSAKIMVHLVTSLPRSIRVPTPKKWIALASSLGLDPVGLLRKVMQVLMDEPHLIKNILDEDEG